ncbi:UDP-N-acetylglucosamine 2-epimerase [Thiopseudomonas alkaliphila]|uniref:non-hydrolyzing UDP-N-acetylglucosamine 2-epimerase n=1 Tax=Thiopseudomonas alkaliphila TaxID=1697053 RepID=UPI00069F0A96|nr:UDP-N-acetylglucosamine 2-epimerase (non-hydrolyzing) [Thiopseudomonas alkaliphila]AKX46110.1 UDP-N-acetylglucosamine 2-epimerase [Thiopseudomonas alkaliphila]AKX56105.1 UDP-N-acetylglucosamine 2-epimerase [Thiopseudomonas alkaliphila]
MKKILTIIGARPQFIKASVVSKAILETEGLSEVIVHTGQHFDTNMSDIFFNQLGIPQPDYLLDINGGSHGDMTGRMLIEIEKVLLEEKPDQMIVYGDTNSTLAGALAAAKLHIPVAHIEAGLRSFNMQMPEEVNRILTDQISNVLFCPTQTAVDNLINEGFDKKPVKILNVGDVMQDSAELFAKRATPPDNFSMQGDFILTTLHRAENTDNPIRLKQIIEALNYLQNTVAPVVLPLHPRTKAVIAKLGLQLKVHIIEPVGYLEMIWLLQHAGLVLTDSGGVQKEAYFFGKPCVTMRDQTEWVELIKVGANTLVGADTDKIVSAVTENYGRKIKDEIQLYGGGIAAQRIAKYLA